MGFMCNVIRLVVLVGLICSGASAADEPTITTLIPEMVTNSTNATTTPAMTTTAAATTKVTKLITTAAMVTNGTVTTVNTTIFNATTPDMTTAASSTSTPMPSNVGKWEVSNKDGDTCMKMQFGGTVTLPILQNNQSIVVDIPVMASAINSTCYDHKSVFNLSSSDDNFEMSMIFEELKSTYTLTTITVTVRVVIEEAPLPPRVYSFTGFHESSNMLEAPLGMFYACMNDTTDMNGMVLTLNNERYQPFASHSGGDYGEAFNCGDMLPALPNELNIPFIVTMSVLVVVVFGGTAGYFLLRMKRKRSGAVYNQM